MKLDAISIKNFRAIRSLSLEKLPDAVVLAGPNGCGKSCVLDAIRLLKSVYGSYQQDEWQTWLGEFQINAQRDPRELLPLFQDRSMSLAVSATIRLSDNERRFVTANARALLRDMRVQQQQFSMSQGRPALYDGWQVPDEEVEEEKAEVAELLSLLASETHEAAFEIRPTGETDGKWNPLLRLVFSTYLPQDLGIIDYHGQNRNYSRERLGSVNLTIESSEQKLRQHALYNYANKYANLKTEMASAYVRHLITRQADPQAKADDALTATLKELFQTFFPGKEFLGPRPTEDGRLLFPVRTESGSEHDIDELSSGEKEVLYGYLRLQSAAPLNSIILIDEPELHLNPRLVSGLAAFYYRHLGARMNNQLWLVTHSDTLIREAVSHLHFAVFHVHPPSAGVIAQASPVKAGEELDRVIMALVGDLATYRPGAKVVVFESTQAVAFDRQMTCALFPEFEQRVNIISAGDKRTVTALYELLEAARKAGHIPGEFFAITDADDEGASRPTRHCQWDAYHIENYLLDPKFILSACRALGIHASELADDAAVLSVLIASAKETIGGLVAHELKKHVNQSIVGSVDLEFDPKRPDMAVALTEALTRSRERIEKQAETVVSKESLVALEERLLAGYSQALEDGTWQRRFRGRES